MAKGAKISFLCYLFCCINQGSDSHIGFLCLFLVDIFFEKQGELIMRPNLVDCLEDAIHDMLRKWEYEAIIKTGVGHLVWVLDYDPMHQLLVGCEDVAAGIVE